MTCTPGSAVCGHKCRQLHAQFIALRVLFGSLSVPAQVRIEAVTEQLLAALEAAEGLPAPQRLAVLAAVTQGLDAHWGLKQYVLVWMFVCLFSLAFCG